MRTSSNKWFFMMSFFAAERWYLGLDHNWQNLPDFSNLAGFSFRQKN